jgi:hypothetical protein
VTSTVKLLAPGLDQDLGRRDVGGELPDDIPGELGRCS